MLESHLKFFICFFCEERFSDKHGLTRHQDTCTMRSFGLQALFTNLTLPRHHELRAPDHSRSTKRSFLESFNIVSAGRAEALGRRNCGEQIVCDVIVIDDSDEDIAEVELQHRPYPLSPRSLIASGGRNFTRNSSVRQSIERKNAVVLKRGSDTIAASHSAEKLLRIDVCSPLGQRLRDHVGTLNRTKFNKPHETESTRPFSNGTTSRNDGDVSCPSTSSFNDRLRQPSDYRITFRPTRQHYRSSYSHAYKFTRRQRKEFCRAFDCGLSVRARRLLSRMKPCRVEVSKLSPQMCCSSVPELELASNRNRVFLPIRESVVSLAKCDNWMVGGSMLNASSYDLNRSKIVNPQVVLCSYECCKRQTSAIRQPSDSSNQCHFDSEASATVSSVFPVTANENIDQFGQQSTSSAADGVATDKSDLLLADSARVCNDNANEISDSSESSPRLITDRTDLLATTAAFSNVLVDPTTSVKTVVQTADKDSQTTHPGTDCGTSLEEMPNTTPNTSSWSMSDDLPALSFYCNICGDVVNCESDSKSLIFDHYAGHGITNIDLMDETTASGEKVIKLIELPTAKVDTSKTTRSQTTNLSTAADRRTSSKSILVQSQSSSRAADAQSGISNTTSAVHTQKTRRRVTWADEVCNSVSQQSQHATSPGIAHQNVAMVSHPSKRPLLVNNVSEMSMSYSTNSVNIPPTSDLSATDSSLYSTEAVESTRYSFPVTSRSDAVSSAIRYPNHVKTSSERARIFWSTSGLKRTTQPSPVVEGPYPRPVSTGVTMQSKRPATSTPAGGEAGCGMDGVYRSRRSMPLSTYTPPGNSTLANNSGVLTRNSSCIPGRHVRSQTGVITLNSCRQSYQQETNIICID